MNEQRIVALQAKMFGYVALIHGSIAKTEGMKSENVLREIQGSPPAYGEEAFGIIAKELESLATAQEELYIELLND